MQYTLRNIPQALDTALRQRAQQEGRSLNEVAVEAMAYGAGLREPPPRIRDLRDVAGTWADDPEFEAALAEQHRIDEEVWR